MGKKKYDKPIPKELVGEQLNDFYDREINELFLINVHKLRQEYPNIRYHAVDNKNTKSKLYIQTYYFMLYVYEFCLDKNVFTDFDDISFNKKLVNNTIKIYNTTIKFLRQHGCTFKITDYNQGKLGKFRVSEQFDCKTCSKLKSSPRSKSKSGGMQKKAYKFLCENAENCPNIRSNKFVPFSKKELEIVYSYINSKPPAENSKQFFCREIINNPVYCQALQLLQEYPESIKCFKNYNKVVKELTEIGYDISELVRNPTPKHKFAISEYWVGNNYGQDYRVPELEYPPGYNAVDSSRDSSSNSSRDSSSNSSRDSSSNSSRDSSSNSSRDSSSNSSRDSYNLMKQMGLPTSFEKKKILNNSSDSDEDSSQNCLDNLSPQNCFKNDCVWNPYLNQNNCRHKTDTRDLTEEFYKDSFGLQSICSNSSTENCPKDICGVVNNKCSFRSGYLTDKKVKGKKDELEDMYQMGLPTSFGKKPTPEELDEFGRNVSLRKKKLSKDELEDMRQMGLPTSFGKKPTPEELDEFGRNVSLRKKKLSKDELEDMRQMGLPTSFGKKPTPEELDEFGRNVSLRKNTNIKIKTT